MLVKTNIKILLMMAFVIALVAIFINIKKQHYPVTIINSYEETFSKLPNIDEHSLVLFDVDDTLITSPDVLARASFFPLSFKLLLLLNHPQLIQNKNWEIVWSEMWQQAPRVITESSVINLITDIKNKGATVLGLTSMESSSYGLIKNMPLWRYTMLKDMGIEFSQKYNNTIFKNFPTYRSSFPILYKGILCANQQNKGDVLNAFLHFSKIKPSKIISFDDDFSALQSIGKVCQQHKIPCFLFNYQFTHFKNIWNNQRALQQFNYLIKEHRWMSDIQLA